MNKFSPEQHRIETASALELVTGAGQRERHAAYIGLDVHKESVAVALAVPISAIAQLAGSRPEPAPRAESS